MAQLQLFILLSVDCYLLCFLSQYKPHDSTLKMRDFLHIMDDYGLVNENLSAKRILEILSNDDPSAYDSIDL